MPGCSAHILHEDVKLFLRTAGFSPYILSVVT